MCFMQAWMPISAAPLCKGASSGKLVDLRDDIVVDENGAIEVFAALDDAMTDSVDLGKRSDRGVLARDQGFKHERHSVVMVRHLRVDDHFIIVKTVLVERLGRTDALANALWP